MLLVSERGPLSALTQVSIEELQCQLFRLPMDLRSVHTRGIGM
jgi:hypothetical protein